MALSFGEKPIPIKPIPKPIMKPRNQTLRPWLLALSKAIGETGGAKNPTKDGVGILQLNTANTFTGKTTVNGGAPGQRGQPARHGPRLGCGGPNLSHC